MKVLLSGVDVVYCALQRLLRSAFLQHIRLSVLCGTCGEACCAAHLAKCALQLSYFTQSQCIWWRTCFAAPVLFSVRSTRDEVCFAEHSMERALERALQIMCCSAFEKHSLQLTCVVKILAFCFHPLQAAAAPNPGS